MADPTDEIERIRARDEATPRDLVSAGYGQVHEDRRTLLAALDAKSHEAWQLQQYQADAEGEIRRARNDYDALRAALDAERAEVERLRAERDQARRAALEEAVAQVDEAITIYLGHASADEPYDWLTTVREHIAKLLDGPDAPEGT